MKCEASQELVVGGFTDPQRSRVGLGALLVGYFDGDDFVFAGKIGTGFDNALLRDLRARLDALERKTSPFTRATGLPKLRVHWVTPQIVVQAAFTEWTGGGKLRHPRLLGVRIDKAARDVVREAGHEHSARRPRAAVTITHPEKVLFPDDGITKGEVAAYYAAVATMMLPHVRGRPVTMERFPSGIDAKGFLQKNVVKGFPELAGARRAAEEGRHGALSAGQRRAVAAVDGQPEHRHPARVAVADAATRGSRTSASSISTRRRDDPEPLRAAALGLRDLLAEREGARAWSRRRARRASTSWCR